MRYCWQKDKKNQQLLIFSGKRAVTTTQIILQKHHPTTLHRIKRPTYARDKIIDTTPVKNLANHSSIIHNRISTKCQEKILQQTISPWTTRVYHSDNKMFPQEENPKYYDVINKVSIFS